MTAPTNLYATDGLCHNAEPGAFNQECGRPATWIGRTRSGFHSGFCDKCKASGFEACAVIAWERR